MTFETLNKLDKFTESTFFTISCCIIGSILGIILTFSNVDYVSATKNDYAPLLQQQEIISKDFNKIYEQENANVHIRKDNIFVKLENNECSLTVYFDKDTNYMYSEKEDKAISIQWFILLLLLSAFSFSLVILVLMYLLFGILQVFLEWLHKRQKISTTLNCFKDVDD